MNRAVYTLSSSSYSIFVKISFRKHFEYFRESIIFIINTIKVVLNVQWIILQQKNVFKMMMINIQKDIFAFYSFQNTKVNIIFLVYKIHCFLYLLYFKKNTNYIHVYTKKEGLLTWHIQNMLKNILAKILIYVMKDHLHLDAELQQNVCKKIKYFRTFSAKNTKQEYSSPKASDFNQFENGL